MSNHNNNKKKTKQMTSKISLEFNDYFMTRECREESFIDFSFVVINTYTKQRYTCIYFNGNQFDDCLS